ncbi:MAG: DUF4159 domain-containing protein [Candidatus Marinimicrobia bacterium]|nr:DUF4159 domain-containing protein [Candidatus Neomarinimicrobiota bacterium]
MYKRLHRHSILPVFVVLIAIQSILTGQMTADERFGKFFIARLKYGGGGDWYSDPSSLPNLLEFVAANTPVMVSLEEYRVSVMDKELFSYPYLYMTGHGNIRFSEEEILKLRQYFQAGGFLHADDNYGMDKSFRREMKRVFPDHEMLEIPFDHPIYHCFFDFPNGLPKIHEHDNKPPQGLGIFYNNHLVVFYSYESDLGDGWEDSDVHNDPVEKHEAALRMGANIILYSLSP